MTVGWKSTARASRGAVSNAENSRFLYLSVLRDSKTAVRAGSGSVLATGRREPVVLLVLAVGLLVLSGIQPKDRYTWFLDVAPILLALPVLLSGSAAMAFLGTQGDVWDTQWDMFLAFTGAISAQLLLSRLQEKELSRFISSHGTRSATA
jgi:hypothetical protein